VQLELVREKLMNIKMESCVACHEKWFDLAVKVLLRRYGTIQDLILRGIFLQWFL